MLCPIDHPRHYQVTPNRYTLLLRFSTQAKLACPSNPSACCQSLPSPAGQDTQLPHMVLLQLMRRVCLSLQLSQLGARGVMRSLRVC